MSGHPGTGDGRRFVAVAPGARPRRLRRTARVLVQDDAGRLLLFADSDPGVPGRRWWITPGGGVEAGESDRDAAVRELAEETGAVVDRRDLIGPIAQGRAIHGYSDVIVEQDEIFFGLLVPGFEVDSAGQTDEERLSLTTHRWWSQAALERTAESVWPGDLTAIWSELRAGLADPAAPTKVLDLGRREESIVPTD